MSDFLWKRATYIAGVEYIEMLADFITIRTRATEASASARNGSSKRVRRFPATLAPWDHQFWITPSVSTAEQPPIGAAKGTTKRPPAPADRL